MRYFMSHRNSRTNPFTRLLADAIEDASGTTVHDFRLRDFCKVGKNDIVHLHWFSPLYHGRTAIEMRCKAFLLDSYFRLLKARGVSLVWTVNNLIAHDADLPDVELMITRCICRRFDGFFAFGEATKKRLVADFGISEEKIRIVPHGTYRAYYEERSSRRAWVRPESFNEGPVYLFFGLLRPYKGLENLIEAFNGGEHNLLIAGGGDQPYVETLRALNTSPNTIIDARRIPDEDIAPLMEFADFVVLPFSSITMSGSMILALSFDKFVISVSDGDVPFYIKDGKNGILLADNSVSSISECLAKRIAAANGTDPEVRATITAMMAWNQIGRTISAFCASIIERSSNEER